MTRTSLASTLLMVGLLWSAAPAAAQHSLESASALYASARYEEALAVLDRLSTNGDTDAAAVKIDVEIHRALCLLALGRDDDAGAAFARVVSTDPWYRLDPKQVSPSVGNFYRAVRKKALPQIAQAKYTEARAAYDRKDFAQALETFKIVRALFDDEDMSGVSPDVKMLASEFQLLAEAQVPPPAPAPTESAPPPPDPPTTVPAEPRIYGAEQPGITPPVAIRQVVPPLPSTLGSIGFPKGVYDLTIDEQGRVIGVIVRRSIHRTYDGIFVEAAARWQYQPAMLEGQPVRYRKSIQVAVSR